MASNNKEIRAAAKAAKVCLWQIAKEFGMNDGNFSRKCAKNLQMMKSPCFGNHRETNRHRIRR